MVVVSRKTVLASPCEAGRQVACDCPGGAKGAQVCEADSSSWGPCIGCTGAGGAGGGTSSSTSSSGGAPPECAVPTDCPGIDNECAHRECANGTCVQALEADGLLVDTGAVGDCAEIRCDGQGHAAQVYDASDPKPDADPCTDDACVGIGQTVHPPKGVKAKCDPGPGVCAFGGQCVECADGSDCESMSAINWGTPQCKCLPATCIDGIQNQGESAPDCGGSSPCSKCGPGKACSTNADCASGNCSMGSCQ